MAWWSRTQGIVEQPKKSVPKGIWTKCERCNATLYEADLDDNARVCTSCNHHFRMPTEGRIQLSIDPGSWQEHDRDLESADPLGFRVDGKKYVDQVRTTTKKVGGGDAYRAGSATIGGIPVEVGFFVFEFMGGSMGSVVGEKIARQFERAVALRRPAIMFCASGSAMMTSPSIATDAATPPVVGCKSTEMYGTRASRSLLRAALVFAICMSESTPSCMRAPPDAWNITAGRRWATARSNWRVIF